MQKKQSRVFVFLLLWIVVMIAVPLVKAKAAATLEVVEIDYDKETLTVRSNSGDTFLYYSDSKKKNWECAYGQFVDAGTSTSEGSTNTSGRIYVLDISWVKKTKDYDLTLKGDVSTEVLTVKLPVQNKYFKVTYNYEKQEFVPQNADNCPLQWRKADSTIWHDVVGEDRSTKETVSMMNKLYAKGAYIYVRTKPQNGDKTTTGVRPSKEIKISLKKQASAPSVSMKTAGILTVNTTQEYRVGESDTWTKCNEKTLDLRKVATDAFFKEGTPGKEVTIYVRVAATEKKLPSASTVITVRAQEEAPVDPKDSNQVEYSFKNATTLQVEFKEVKKIGEDGKEVVVKEKPSSKNPYEYTVVKPAEGTTTAQPAEDATWTAITAGTVTISAEKAPAGSVLFIRKRGRLESKVVYQPESLACEHIVGGYPAGSTVELVEGSDPNMAFMENVTIDGKPVQYLRLVKEQGGKTDKLKFVVKVTYDITSVSSITCGGKSLKFDTEVVTGSAVTEGTTTGSAITVTITNTSEYEATLKEFDKDQPLKITLKNGEVIADKVTLKVLPGASVEKAETFEVIHRIKDKQNELVFKVNAGMVIPSRENTGASAKYTQIKSISFQDKSIDIADGMITLNSDGKSYTVKIPESAFDNAFLDEDIKLDEAYPLVIEMDNEQEVAGISVKLHENLKVKDELHISFSEGTEKESVTVTFTGANTSHAAVRWNNSNVGGVSSTGTGDVTTVTISKNGFKNLKQGDSAPVIFTFTDGNIVSRAMWLTIGPQEVAN